MGFYEFAHFCPKIFLYIMPSISPPRTKTAILAPFSEPIKPDKIDFSQTPTGVPPITFWGLKWSKKVFYSIFDVSLWIMKFGF